MSFYFLSILILFSVSITLGFLIPIVGKPSNIKDIYNKNKNDFFFSLIIFFILIILSLIIYYSIGSPNVAEMPFEKRVKKINEIEVFLPQDTLEKLVKEKRKKLSFEQNNVLQLILKLKEKINDDDILGHRLIVKNSILIDDFITARISQEKISKSLKNQENFNEILKLIELSILAANGKISKESKKNIERINLLNNKSFESKYYQGLVYAQQYEKIKALKLWIKLSKNLKENDLRKKLIFNQISKLYLY